MHAREFFRVMRVCCLVALALLARTATTASQSPSPGTNALPPAPAAVTRDSTNTDAPANSWPDGPKPTSIDRTDLDAAFTKSAPASLNDLKAIQKHVEDLLKEHSPTVVAVEVGNGSGSGVVISSDGYVLTAGHVCGAPGRRVTFLFPDGRRTFGKTLGVHPTDDIGLMKINGGGPWPYAKMGSQDSLRNGDWVLALGHPGGFDATRSLVVRLGRIISLPSATLRTDCTISPGDSGGPLFDMFGRVVGIHSYISTSMTANFHVSVDGCFDSWEQLLYGRPAPTGYIGLSEIDNGGCRITSVARSSPASKAGLKVGDIVTKVDGRDILVAAFLKHWEAESKPGETLKLEVKRGKETLTFDVVVAKPPTTRRG